MKPPKTLPRKTIADETPSNTSIRQVCQLSSLQKDPWTTQNTEPANEKPPYGLLRDEQPNEDGDEEHVWVTSTGTASMCLVLGRCQKN